ncbi:hypothetical protein ACFW7J_21315 [Streptomyces sp. NPDC059525]|uniref:hypothetical protein n=1 Tax=Streptomyces sp. NPDC059525 TaxID=3346857 RepID=UPI003689AADD
MNARPLPVLALAAAAVWAGPADSAVALETHGRARPLVSVDCLAQGATVTVVETGRRDAGRYTCRSRGAILLDAGGALQGAAFAVGGQDNTAVQTFR